MNSIAPINVQKVSYLRNNQPQSLSKPITTEQNTCDSCSPSFRACEKSLSPMNIKKYLAGILVLLTGIFASEAKIGNGISQNANAYTAAIKKQDEMSSLLKHLRSDLKDRYTCEEQILNPTYHFNEEITREIFRDRRTGRIAYIAKSTYFGYHPVSLTTYEYTPEGQLKGARTIYRDGNTRLETLDNGIGKNMIYLDGFGNVIPQDSWKSEWLSNYNFFIGHNFTCENDVRNLG